MLYTADFETTTNENDCRVWAWGVCEIGRDYNFQYGNNINTFFDFLYNSKNSKFYFHNEKFDGTFILCWLFKNGYKHVDRSELDTKTFCTLISDSGQFYSIKICFEKKGKRVKNATIYDSLKIIPFSVDVIAKSFNLSISKLEIDYTTDRPPGHILTPQEVDYLKNDVTICAKALNTLFEQNLQKITQGSNALYDYIQTVGKNYFEKWFPVLEPWCDRDIRQAYKGGFTYLKPEYAGRDIKSGIVLDVNSLYPFVLREMPLPCGYPIYFDGKYIKDDLYPLYVQMIRCQFDVKPGKLPTIQLKNNLAFIPNQYITSSEDEVVTMCLTNVDLELFFEHYNVYNLEYLSGWKFMQSTEMFKPYIDKWMQVKIESTLNGNKGMRTLAKLMLNALYGKFGKRLIMQSKIPYNEAGVVKYTLSDKEETEGIYIPVAVFVTAWARNITIRSAQKMYKNFVYADTDSLHLEFELPEDLQKMDEKQLEFLTTEKLIDMGIPIHKDIVINPVNLGAWKCESKFFRARFVRQKCYIEDGNIPEAWDNENYKQELLNVTCAGMPKRCHNQVTWDNFKVGATFTGKLVPKNVVGGQILVETEFTIKG